MKYENLSKLLAQFETDLENMKYTEATFKGTSSVITLKLTQAIYYDISFE